MITTRLASSSCFLAKIEGVHRLCFPCRRILHAGAVSRECNNITSFILRLFKKRIGCQALAARLLRTFLLLRDRLILRGMLHWRSEIRFWPGWTAQGAQGTAGARTASGRIVRICRTEETATAKSQVQSRFTAESASNDYYRKTIIVFLRQSSSCPRR
jgi:hypothetical protein